MIITTVIDNNHPNFLFFDVYFNLILCSTVRRIALGQRKNDNNNRNNQPTYFVQRLDLIALVISIYKKRKILLDSIIRDPIKRRALYILPPTRKTPRDYNGI